MNLEALLVIGVVTLALGLFLYVPGYFLGKWLNRRIPAESQGRMRITGAGFIGFGVLVCVLMAGFSMQHLAPESSIGRFVSSGNGRLEFTIALILLWVPIELVCNWAGIPLARREPSTVQPGTPALPFGTRDRAGYVRIANIWGLPVFVFWPILPMLFFFPLIAVFAGATTVLVGMSSFLAAYLTLILIHEFGHVAAVRLVGLRTLSVEISGFGGRCHFEHPSRYSQLFAIASGGLVAQAALFAVAQLCAAIYGTPSTQVGRAYLITFTWVNAFVAFVNLVPVTTTEGLALDGKVLLTSLLGMLRKQKPSKILSVQEAPVFPTDKSLLSMPALVPEGFVHGIEIFNDRTTPMEFVVIALMNHLEFTREEAIKKMLEIHNNGGVLISLPTRGWAERVAQRITEESAQRGHKLTCRAVGVQ